MKQWVAILVLACPACVFATVGSGPYGVAVDAVNRPQPTSAPPPLLADQRHRGDELLDHLPRAGRGHVRKSDICLERGRPRLARLRQRGQEPERPPSPRATTSTPGNAQSPSRTLCSRWPYRSQASRRWARSTSSAPGSAGIHRSPAAEASVGVAAAASPGAGDVPRPPAYPDQHLLTTPFRVPPGLFAKRWILLSTSDNPPGGCVGFDDPQLRDQQSRDRPCAAAIGGDSPGPLGRGRRVMFPRPPPYEYGH